MRARRVTGRNSRALTTLLVLLGALAGLGPGTASASACVAGAGQPVRPGSSNALGGIEVASCQAWVVGDYTTSTGSPRTLIEHWEGTAWARQSSPSPGTSFDSLNGVTATSASDVWAVGQYSSSNPSGATAQTLAEHWNGTTWAQVPSPSPGGPTGYSLLNAVAATSASNALAVGDYNTGPGTPLETLAEHWDGTTWTRVPIPAPGGGTTPFNYLSGVAATSASNAWAVGWYSDSAGGALTLIEHWDGNTWTQVPSPSPGGPGRNNWLLGVTATSATDAWAVGRTFHRTVPYQYQALIEHWNGTTWTQVPSPTPSTSIDAQLVAVAATSASNALAVGYYTNNAHPFPATTLVERWNGTAWTQLPSPNPSSINNWLSGVAATSAATFLAVGASATGSQGEGRRILALHVSG